jgi:hypothetical protein
MELVFEKSYGEGSYGFVYRTTLGEYEVYHSMVGRNDLKVPSQQINMMLPLHLRAHLLDVDLL